MIQEVCVCFDRFLAVTDSQKKRKKIEKKKKTPKGQKGKLQGSYFGWFLLVPGLKSVGVFLLISVQEGLCPKRLLQARFKTFALNGKNTEI